ncbi:hypothetical protein [Herbaspirillum sp. YR522]|uniref:hypothetical protein n=1 Tax=Herbaspirillum sp. YR522 TaxID=1144342 RepID=UPI00026F99B1|nr:hypothetical protein [Herbaspirillum sp. YR522]EJN07957.1 hypothetical protein PMI40_01585 [Herbaspirillum sp. YR522]
MRSVRRNIAVVGWLAFLMAVAAEGIFFSMTEPILLAQAMGVESPDALGVYTLGFLGFWGSFTLCGLLAVCLTQELPQAGRPRRPA